MLILISPAKTLDYQSPLATERYTQPELLDYSQQLIHEARKLSAYDEFAVVGPVRRSRHRAAQSRSGHHQLTQRGKVCGQLMRQQRQVGALGQLFW